MATIKSINPATGEEVGEYLRLTEEEAFRKVATAGEAYKSWKQTTFAERAALMRRLADELLGNKEYYAQLATAEMGKIITQSRKEIEKCALICRYYADNGEQLLAPQPVQTEGRKSYVTFQPQGVVLAVMPWNFPFYQVVRFAAPALMAGNVGVLKHASNVQGCAYALEKAFEKAGFPPNVFLNLNVSPASVSGIIARREVVAVALTGSEDAGRKVAAAAGQNLKKTVLELGGSDPYIVLEDADIDFAVSLTVATRMQNCGQTCISGKRFIVASQIYDRFLQAFTEKMKSLKMGDPIDENVDYGPMSRADLRDELHAQVEKSIGQGARLVLGGVVPPQNGAYYPATVLADVRPGMEAFDNELFGPVAAVIRAEDEQDAIRLANQSLFGLGGGVVTGNPERGEKVALQIESGSCFVNKFVISDPRLPFGGVKNSGYGRELSGYGIKEFVNIKSVWVD